MFDTYNFDELMQEEKDEMILILNSKFKNKDFYTLSEKVDNADFDTFVYGNSQFTTSDGASCYEVLDKTVSDCHYDNGVGLNEKGWYFGHFDRDQDYYEMFNDDKIVRYEWNADGKLLFILKYPSDTLRKRIIRDVDGSSYEHDFGNRV